MSGLAGIYCLDGRPADVGLLRRMIATVAHRGPDGEGDWSDGPVALAQCAGHTTPESFGEKQPLVDETGVICLALDGRVDNREALAEWLRSRGVVPRTPSDAELVLQAYALSGDECLARIVGDFALAIWARHSSPESA